MSELFLLFLRIQMADNPGGIAAYDDIVRYVSDHDGSGGDNAVFADRHAGTNRALVQIQTFFPMVTLW